MGARLRTDQTDLQSGHMSKLKVWPHQERKSCMSFVTFVNHRESVGMSSLYTARHYRLTKLFRSHLIGTNFVGNIN